MLPSTRSADTIGTFKSRLKNWSVHVSIYHLGRFSAIAALPISLQLGRYRNLYWHWHCYVVITYCPPCNFPTLVIQRFPLPLLLGLVWVTSLSQHVASAPSLLPVPVFRARLRICRFTLSNDCKLRANGAQRLAMLDMYFNRSYPFSQYHFSLWLIYFR